jgi:hypothetical protein
MLGSLIAYQFLKRELLKEAYASDRHESTNGFLEKRIPYGVYATD